MSRPVRLDSRLGRLVQRAAQSSSFQPIALKAAPRMDKVVSRLSTNPLATLADGADVFYVVGSDVGTEKHPAWTGNRTKTPRATVVSSGTTLQVDARLLTDDEKAAVWPRLTAMWPTYDTYVARTDRNLRVFHLTRVP